MKNNSCQQQKSEEPLKILLTADPFLPVPPKLYGGIERIVASLIFELRGRGYLVGLVAIAGSSVSVDFFQPWRHENPRGSVAHCQNAITLRMAFKEFEPAVVHSFSRLLYLAPILPQRTPKIMSYQRFPGGSQIALGSLVGGRSLLFTGCSEFIAAMGRKHGGAWRTIPNFVSASDFNFNPTVSAEAPLVFLGRIETIKGTHTAIEIAKRAGRRLLIAGNHSETGVEGEYWSTVIKPQLDRNGIEYVGPVNDRMKNRLLGSACAMIAPIHWDEPFGIVFAEALACGTPVITYPRGAAPEIIRNGMEGFLIRDVEDGTNAVHMIATIDRRQCRARAEQAFSSAAVVPQYEAVYAELLHNA